MRITFLAAAVLLAAQTQPPPAQQQAVISKYCAGCHNEKLKTADLVLDKVDKADIAHPANNPVLWEKVLHKLRAREMPPPKMPRPDEAAYESLTSYLETALDKAAADKPNTLLCRQITWREFRITSTGRRPLPFRKFS